MRKFVNKATSFFSCFFSQERSTLGVWFWWSMLLSQAKASLAKKNNNKIKEGSTAPSESLETKSKPILLNPLEISLIRKGAFASTRKCSRNPWNYGNLIETLGHMKLTAHTPGSITHAETKQPVRKHREGIKSTSTRKKLSCRGSNPRKRLERGVRAEFPTDFPIFEIYLERVAYGPKLGRA